MEALPKTAGIRPFLFLYSSFFVEGENLLTFATHSRSTGNGVLELHSNVLILVLGLFPSVKQPRRSGYLQPPFRKTLHHQAVSEVLPPRSFASLQTVGALKTFDMHLRLCAKAALPFGFREKTGERCRTKADRSEALRRGFLLTIIALSLSISLCAQSP